MACRVEIVAKTPLPRDNGVKRIRRFAGTAVVAAGAFICCPSSALAAVHVPGRMQTTAFVPGLSMLSFRSETLGSSGVSCRPKMAGLRAAGMALAKETDKAAREGGVKVSKATDYYKPLVEGDILESTDTQRAIVVFSYGILALLGMKAAVMLSAGEGSVIGFLIAALVGFEFADFGSGVYHWSMDNYGNKDTPVFGTQIVAFQVGALSSCAPFGIFVSFSD